MKKFIFKSIRTRLTFWFLVVTLVPLLFVLSINYIQQSKVLEESAFTKLTTIRDSKVNEVNKWINEKMGNLYVMAGDFEIRGLENIFSKKSKSSEDLIKIEIARVLLNRNLRNHTDYSEIFIIDTKTRLVEISTNLNRFKENKSQNSYFSVPLETGEAYIKDIYRSATSKEPEMTLSMPIYCLSHNQHIIGILVVRIDLKNSLYKMLLNRTGLGETGEVLIVNQDVIALNELRWHENTPLNLQISAEPAVNAAAGKTGITITPDYRGEEVLAAYTYIPQTKWGFVSKQDLNELYTPIREMAFNYIIIFIIVLLIVFLIAYSISKTISKPILKMDVLSKKIKGGDFSVRNVIRSNDELGSLADSINEMTDSIQSKSTIQNGVVDISKAMIGQSSIQEFSSKLLKQLMEVTKCNMSVFYILNERTSEFEPSLSIGANKEMLKTFNSENSEGEFGNAIVKKSIYYLSNIPEDTIFKFQTTAGEAIPKEIITIPILADNIVVALISLVNIQKFSKESYDILDQSWLGLNSSYSTLLANDRTRILAENLSKINQELESKSEELQEQTEELQSQTEELSQQSEELQEQNLELELQRKDVFEANRLKSQFLSNMSHELRTPLNSVIALSDVLIKKTEEKLSSDEYKYLGIIERNGRQLLQLINDILDISKIESGKMEIVENEFNLFTVIDEMCERLKPIADKKGLSLINDTVKDLPLVKNDLQKVNHILQNLIGNAIKFTKKGRVEVIGSVDNENLIVSVKDSGIGLTNEEMIYIFDEFRQVDGTTSRKFEGTGLGLSIVKKYAETLGGSISVESEIGSGSTFTLILPINDAKNNFDKNEFFKLTPYEKSLHESSCENSNIQNLKGKRILLVEDNETAVIQIKGFLKEAGLKVDFVNNGKEAIKYVQKTIPDGIILDLMMPEMDGFEVMEKIRSIKKSENIPIIILSAKDLTDADIKKLNTFNIKQIIKKGDVDKRELLQKINFMLELNGNKNEVSVKTEKIIRTEKPVPSLKGKRINTGHANILIIEDNEDNMESIKAILDYKYNIYEAYDGDEGLKAAFELKPDLILLDISIPIKDGFQVLSEIQESNKLNVIPVIVVSALAMLEDREKIFRAGATDYVSKPISSELLLDKIEMVLSERLQ